MRQHGTTPARHAWRAILWSEWAFACQLAMAAWAHAFMPPGTLRTLLILAPMLSASLIVGVTWWLYQSSDEYLRLRVLRAGTVTAMVMALLATAYCLAELLGWPRLSMSWPLVVGWGVFGAQMLPLVFAQK